MPFPVPILLYHSISERVAPGFRRFAVSPTTFAVHMAHLRDFDYTPMTVSQLVKVMAGDGSALPARPVVITFDDGLADFYSDALPILRKHGFPATLYIVTSYINQTSRWLHREGEGQRLMLRWDQIAEISKNGIECGAHSHRHPQLDLLRPAEARDEIFRSKSILEQGLGQPITSFAYPYGYYNTAARRAVQEAGYSSACAVRHAMSTTADDRYALARMVVTPDMDVEDFAALLTGERRFITERLQTMGWKFVRRGANKVKRAVRSVRA